MLLWFQAVVAQKKTVGHADKAVVIPGYSFVSNHTQRRRRGGLNALGEGRKLQISDRVGYGCS